MIGSAHFAMLFVRKNSIYLKVYHGTKFKPTFIAQRMWSANLFSKDRNITEYLVLSKERDQMRKYQQHRNNQTES